MATVTISWNKVPDAISYNIYFSSTSGATKLKGYKIPNASNPITVTDLDLGKTYYFAISVVDESGESIILSEEAYMVMNNDGMINFLELTPRIQNLKGQVNKTQVREGQVTLSWDNMPNAISYNIYYSDSQGVAKQKGKKIANVKTPYTIKGLKRGRIYYFVVTAATNFGESKESTKSCLLQLNNNSPMTSPLGWMFLNQSKTIGIPLFVLQTNIQFICR